MNGLMKTLDVIAGILLIIGGLNWGLVGLFDFNLVSAIFGEGGFSRVIYTLVGIAAIYEALQLRGMQHRWACLPTRGPAEA